MLTGNSQCQNSGTCMDGIGQYTCDCTGTGFCGRTCTNPFDPSQNGGQCCEDDLTWGTVMNADDGTPAGRVTCSDFMGEQEDCFDDDAVDAAGVTAAIACPITCQSDCSVTYDDCCKLAPHLRPCTSVISLSPSYCVLSPL